MWCVRVLRPLGLLFNQTNTSSSLSHLFLKDASETWVHSSLEPAIVNFICLKASPHHLLPIIVLVVSEPSGGMAGGFGEGLPACADPLMRGAVAGNMEGAAHDLGVELCFVNIEHAPLVLFNNCMSHCLIAGHAHLLVSRDCLLL